ncbi:molybdopterin-guanine dinucleotide biosynthesis protein B [Pararhizobium haloflavum]|uniref:molybdopterin-guanine dinucleotide biosynthesis protein B n=1 Tax=Pararhizobium haloflavum TaxID=2037914 RepID=UPI000C185570|nr:molybdopterin-guanine dinucleotide biosynthesis protein B [Pararhizobium haloflavum]
MTGASTPRVFGVTGWKNSGKTGLTVRIVEELTRRGWRVSTIKHAHHEFDIDRQDSDSWRHRQAGAGEVAIVSGNRWALMHELRNEKEPALADILARLTPCDLVVIEGYKREGHMKIETRRRDSANQMPLAPNDPAIVAIAADQPPGETSLPVFDLNDTIAICDFVEAMTGLSTLRKTAP